MKRLSILLMVILVIVSLSAASAADTNQTDYLTASEDCDNLEIDDETENLQIDENSEVLSATGNFTSLSEQINADGVYQITLNDDYTRQAGENDIVINKSFTINGNNHKIDANNLGRIFNVTDSGYLTLNNLVLCNGLADNGGAIYLQTPNSFTLRLNNVNFTNFSAYSDSASTVYGGALNIQLQGDDKQQLSFYIDGVHFNNCTAHSDVSPVGGGALYINAPNTGRIWLMPYTNTEFTNCRVYSQSRDVYGGAICVHARRITHYMGDTNFNNCTVYSQEGGAYGGALYIKSTSNGDVFDWDAGVNFNNCSAYSVGESAHGGAICIEGTYSNSVAL